ncbi:MAG: calcium/sodium antiporter [Kiritimatiellae bacterium]|nr:calcium/sodium antiporter [Kiritimatiellia bacterium]
MYTDIPLWASILFMAAGLVALAWSSDTFVDGASSVAKALGISPFVIGMVIIGFGTSAPELCVSVMSGLSSHSNLSLGNAYGSCVFNIAAILGIASLIRPLAVKPATAFVAGPALAAISAGALFALRDGVCSRGDALVMLAAFALLLPLYCWFDQKTGGESSAEAVPAKGRAPTARMVADPRYRRIGRLRLVVAWVKLAVGLVVLIGSSHLLVWGAVDFARTVGVSDLMIGLTIIAAGTSLPELASAIASARRGEHEFVLGNIVGSNFFNMLAVVGLAAVISPAADFSRYIVLRDLPVAIGLSLAITVFGVNWRRPREPGSFNRFEGAAWILVFLAYTALVIYHETHV